MIDIFYLFDFSPNAGVEDLFCFAGVNVLAKEDCRLLSLSESWSGIVKIRFNFRVLWNPDQFFERGIVHLIDCFGYSLKFKLSTGTGQCLNIFSEVVLYI